MRRSGTARVLIAQYCSHDDQKILREHGFQASMRGKGNCYDNAAVLRRENSLLDCFLILLTFFRTIKAELIWRRTWETRRQAQTAIFQYIIESIEEAQDFATQWLWTYNNDRPSIPLMVCTQTIAGHRRHHTRTEIKNGRVSSTTAPR